MKKVGSIGLWLYLVPSVCVLFAQSAYAEGGLRKITDNVYAYADVKGASPQKSFGANAGIIVGRDGIVVVDTLISAKEAQRLIRDIRKVSDKPIRYVVNTHWHLDHAFGNSEFEKIGAIIVSHDADKANLIANGQETLNNAKAHGLTDDDMAGTILAYPVLFFSDRLRIDLGDQTVDLIYPGPSHSRSSIMVYVPQRKVLFAGDILFTGYHPFTGEGDIEAWIKALDGIMAFDVSKIIPGHGPVSTKQDVIAMKDYLTIFDRKARELAARSNDVKYIASELEKALPERPELPSMIPSNIQMKYIKKEQ